jgi:homoserine O-acetyltransferase
LEELLLNVSQNLAIDERRTESLVIDGVLDLPSPWTLHYGDRLEGARVGFRMIGPPAAPIVAALGGISGHRYVAAPKGEGWWHAIAGPDLAIDTTRYRVLGLDYLGGRGASTRAPDGGKFPPISAYDQAEALREVLHHLGIRALHAIVGSSYGGMVALSFADRHPDVVGRIVVMGAAERPQPLSTAWRSVQRQIVRDALARGDGAEGLKLARAMAMTTYRSAAELALRFGGEPTRDAERFRFPVEEYLFARGENYVQHYRPESFLSLSESIDLHRIDATRIQTPATLIAVREDQLVPLADMQALAQHLKGPVQLVEINSIYGHDAFLTEGAALKPIIGKALTETLQ